MKDFYTSQELLEYSSAIALIEKYEFYNKYVKPLENEYEELYIEYENVFDELQELKEKKVPKTDYYSHEERKEWSL